MDINLAAPWAPDLAAVDVEVLADARNVYPSPVGKRPIPSMVSFGADALPEPVLGGQWAQTSDGDAVLVVGTATGLYKLVGTTWTDVSRTTGGAYSSTGRWSFAQFSGDTVNRLFATNLDDDIQALDIDDPSAKFVKLSDYAPKAKYLAVINRYLIAGHLAHSPIGFAHCDFNDADVWLDDPSPPDASQADEQALNNLGRVMGVGGSEAAGYIVQEGGVRLMTYQPGNDYPFAITVIEGTRGCNAAYGCVFFRNEVFYPTEDGIVKVGPSGYQPISEQAVSRWLLDNISANRTTDMLGAIDPQRAHVLWAFPTGAAAEGTCDRLLGYDVVLGQWWYAILETQFVAGIATPGLGLESLPFASIDAMDTSLDSRAFEGGRPVLALFNTSNRLSLLSGNPMTAILESTPREANPGGRAYFSEIHPKGRYGGATVSVEVGCQEYDGADINWLPAAPRHASTGIVPKRASARLFTFRTSITHGGTAWTHAQGLATPDRPDGRR